MFFILDHKISGHLPYVRLAVLAIVFISSEIINCSGEENETSSTISTIFLETIPPTTTSTTTTTAIPMINSSSLASSLNQTKANVTVFISNLKNSSHKDFFHTLDCVLLIGSNFALIPAIYLTIKGKLRGETVVYSMAMIFSAVYHFCDCNRIKFFIFPYDMWQFGDFISATLTFWCTAILIANVPFEWVSAFHLGGAIIFSTSLHYRTTGTWTFIIPIVCTTLLLASYWGYHYYRDRRFPDLVYSSNFYAAVGLMIVGVLMFASQKIPYVNKRLYGITHSVWHVTMSLAMYLLLPRCPDTESFWFENLKIGTSINNAVNGNKPLVTHKNDVNITANSSLRPAPSPPATEQRTSSYVNNGFSF